MSLPSLNTDIRYTVTLPISGKKLKVRPYLVKEEKILLISMESKNKQDIVDAVFQVLHNCTDNHPVGKLPLNDVEHLLLKLKMYSSGEIVPVNVRCNNPVKKPVLNPETGEDTGKVEKRPCGQVTTLEINLEEELKIDTSGIKDNRIELTDDGKIGVVLRPPTFDVFSTVINAESGTEISFEFLADCIDSVWQDDEHFSEFSPAEAQAFLESMNKKQLTKIEEYIASLPKQKIERDYKCPTCGHSEKLVLKDFFDFFTD